METADSLTYKPQLHQYSAAVSAKGADTLKAMHAVRRTLEGLGILLACVYVAWLAFVDPTYLALNDDDPLLITALAVSLTAALFFAACVAYWTLTKAPNEAAPRR